MIEDKKKVYLRSFGCQMNVRDSEVVCGLLQRAGFVLVDSPDEAGVVLLNTCSVRQHAEDKVWSEIGRIAKRHERCGRRTARPVIGVIGCMAQNYREKLFERQPCVDFVVGPGDIAKIPEIIEKLWGAQEPFFERKIWETDGEVRPEEIYHAGFREDASHAYVVISEGCSNYCSYCVVPFVRGALRHRRPEDIIREIEEAVQSGIPSVTLLGQNVNAYRSTVDFTGLLRQVDAIPGLKEFGFITSHPKDTHEGFFKAMAECKRLRKYLHLPVQAGSDRILKLMNRGYTRKNYLDLAEAYRTMVPEGILTTDVIVGFPGETEEDFKATLSLMHGVRFDAAFIFKYSVRPRTAAAQFADDVPQIEKERRHAEVLSLQKKISYEKKRHAK